MNPILSHIITFFSGLIVGVFGNYYAARLSEKAKGRDLDKERKKKFLELKSKMPKLIKEMIADLKNPDMKNCREFFLSPSKGVVFNTSQPTFFYYEDEHSNLRSSIRTLEKEGFVFDITEGESPKYQFTEEFVNLLK
jgi:hypothetical protein